MHIVQLNKKELLEFIHSPQFDVMPVIPITSHRALSHIHNPAVKENDILLLLAYIEKELVGYLGVLPDTIYAEKSTPYHCGWMSCLWVSEHHRGKKIAQQLITACFASWENKIIATEFTKPAKALYDKTGYFDAFTTLHGLRLYMRSDLQYILPHKKNVFKKLVPMLRLCDAVVNFFTDIRFKFIKTINEGYQVETLQEWNEEIIDLITLQNSDALFKRNAKGLQWIIQYPWIISKQTNDNESSRYHFSSTDTYFKNIPLQVRNADGKIIAILLFTNRNGRLKLPYCFYSCTEDLIAKIIVAKSLEWKVNSVTVFNEKIAHELGKIPNYALWQRNVQREYIISKELLRNVEFQNVIIQDGDGDCAFT